MHYRLVFSSSIAPMDRPENSGLDLGAIPAAGNRYRVGRPFGSNRHKGEDLGSYVPALFVSTAPGERPMEVYPHEELDGKVTTIADHLRDRRAHRG